MDQSSLEPQNLRSGRFVFRHIDEDVLRHERVDLSRPRWTVLALDVADLEDVRDVVAMRGNVYSEHADAVSGIVVVAVADSMVERIRYHLPDILASEAAEVWRCRR